MATNYTGQLPVSSSSLISVLAANPAFCAAVSACASDIYPIAASLAGNTLSITQSNGGPTVSVDLSGLSSADSFLTSATLVGTVLTLGVVGQPSVSVDLASLSTPLVATDSSTIDFTTSGVSGHDLTADVKISATPGDVTLSVNPDGLVADLLIDPSRGDVIITSSAAGVKAEAVRDWTTGTAYLVNDLVYDAVSGNAYRATVAHTAGASLAADIVNWVPLVSSAENIYTDDGSLTADRTVTLNGHYLRMVGSNGAAYFFADGTARNSRWGLAPLTVSTPAALPLTAYAPDFSNNTAHRYVVNATSTGDVALTASTGLAYGELASIVIDNLRATDVNVTFDASYKDASGAAVASIVVPAGERHAIVFAGENSSTATVLAGGGTFTETTLTVTDTDTVNLTAGGVNGHAISADVRIDTVTPGNVTFSSSVNGLAAAVAFPADLRVVSIAASVTPGIYTATLSDSSTFNVDLSALDEAPATAISPADTATGAVGTSALYAREDHAHPVTIGLTATGAAITMTVNAVTATLTPAVGTVQDYLGFNAAGDLVKQASSATNIYTNDGTLAANRTVTMGGRSLTFDGSSNDVVIDTSGYPTSGRWGLISPVSTTVGAGAIPNQFLSFQDQTGHYLTVGVAATGDLTVAAITDLQNGEFATYTIDNSRATPLNVNLPGTVTAGGVAVTSITIPAASSYTLAFAKTAGGTGFELLNPPAGASTNLYNTDGSLTGNRVVNLNGHFLSIDGSVSALDIGQDGIPISDNFYRTAHVTTFGAGAIPAQTPDLYTMSNVSYTAPATSTGDLTITPTVSLGVGQIATVNVRNERAGTLGVVFANGLGQDGAAIPAQTLAAGEERSYVVVGRMQSAGGYTLIGVSSGSAPAGTLTIETKTGNYTTVAADQGKYIRFTGGVPTFHVPAAGEIGQQIIIRNATGAALTAIATGSTVNGSLTVSNTECLAMLCVAAGTWDAIGGI